MNKDRMIAFNTRACMPSSETLAEDVVSIIQGAEGRKRARRANDLKSFKQAVDYILGDMLLAYVGESSQYAYRAEGKTNFYGSPVGHSTWKSIMSVLIDLGYIEYFKGTNHKNPFDESSYLSGSASRFLATESLVGLAESHGINFDKLSEHYVTEMPESVLKLKASKRGKLDAKELPITETPKTEALAAQVHRLNKYLSKQTLTGGSFEGYRRSFSNGELAGFDWNQGGRLYAVGNSYQHLSGDRRALMQINGEPVVEVDVSASHLSIYMGEMGHRAADGIDLYAIDGLSRAAVKQYIASSFGLGKLITKWSAEAQAEVTAFDVVDVKEAVCGAIPCFVSLADSGLNWATLQFLETEALTAAMQSLHEQDIPAYGVHDSLIVPVTTLEATRNALKNAWQIRGWSIRLK
ncbi:MAG: hypothetical protein ACKVJ2_08600 [Pseudomonadales bacterium]